MKYKIFNQCFRTKKEAHEYTSNFLKKNKYQTITEGFSFNYLMGMVNIHHKREEKIADGIESFYIGDDWNRKTALFINQKTEKKVSISWVQICKFKPPTRREEFLSSLRQSINYQIEDFKKHCCLICELCNSTKIIHIDHIYPFKYIVQDFEQEFKFTIPERYTKEPITNKTMFLQEDKDLRENFVLFHKSKSDLRPLCRDCNLRRKKKIENYVLK
tara:strand:+ start:2013 stop:2660 length:648 start_codon:yes stop_codon:yes gene_type:complete